MMWTFAVVLCVATVGRGQDPARSYGIPQREGGSLSPVAEAPPVPAYAPPPAPAPVYAPAPAPVYAAPPAPAPVYAPAPAPGSQGGDVSPVVELPENSRLSITDDRGQYSHGFSDKEGTTFQEQGSLFSTNEGWEYVIVKKGSYSYKSPEGKTVTVHYIADHNGFRVLGRSIV